MEDTEYCCCCRIHHPRRLMRRPETRHGVRWRCLRSLEAARRSVEERDDFGRQQSAHNRESARQAARHSIRIREFSRHLP